MKNKFSEMLDQFDNILIDKAYAGLRGLCFYAGFLSLWQLLVLAIIHQWTGQVPSIEHLSLIFWSWRLPFGISRLWDVSLLPLFCYFSYRAFRVMEDQECEMGNVSNDHSGFLDIAMFSLVLAFLGGLVFGILYAIPIFAIAFIGIPSTLFKSRWRFW